MEPECSLPHSQESATYTSPQPIPILSQNNPVHVSSILLKTHFGIILLSIYGYIFQVVSFSQVSLPKPCTYLLHALLISFSWFDDRNYIWWALL